MLMSKEEITTKMLLEALGMKETDVDHYEVEKTKEKLTMITTS